MPVAPTLWAASSATTAVVALCLMSVSTLQAMAAVLSKSPDGTYPYKVIGATLLSEAFKLVVSLVLLGLELSRKAEPTQRQVAMYYTARSVTMAAVPGFAYQILNNLNFVTLQYVDAPTFQILGNTKIVATGVAGVCLLNRRLSRGKWLALLLLTLGAATTQIPQPRRGTGNCEPAHWFEGRLVGYVSAFICVFLSATMGVFTELFMKGNKASIHFQNVQLYFFGIVANALALAYRGEIGPSAETHLLHGFNFWAAVTVVTNGGCGLLVAFLLKFADSIAKTYATALAIPCTSLAAALFLGTPISPPNMLGSTVMVISLAYFYKGDALFGQVPTSDNKSTANKAPAR